MNPLHRLRPWWILLLGVALLAVALVWWRSTPAGQLAAARARWAARPFSHYRLQFEYTVFSRCLQDVEVRDEEIVTVHLNACSHRSNTITSTMPPLTVVGLFSRVEYNLNLPRCGPNGCACDGPIGVDVDYDETLGFPRRMEVRLMPELRWLYPQYWHWRLLGGIGICQSAFFGERFQVIALTPLD